jgi:hypothetical protein
MRSKSSFVQGRKTERERFFRWRLRCVSLIECARKRKDRLLGQRSKQLLLVVLGTSVLLLQVRSITTMSFRYRDPSFRRYLHSPPISVVTWKLK